MKFCATRRARDSDSRESLHRRLAWALGLVGALLVLTGLFKTGQVEARRIHVPLVSTKADATVTSPGTADAVPSSPSPKLGGTPISVASKPQTRPLSATVHRGDNLSLVFSRLGLGAKTVHQLLQSQGENKELARLFPGQEIDLSIDPHGNLISLHLRPDRLVDIEYRRSDAGFERFQTIRTPERREVYRQATLENSLFVAGARAGLSDKLIMELAGIFNGVIDFVLDPRSGDTFSLLYEELWLDGERIGDGKILAAEYTNSGQRHTAFRYVDQRGDSGYFDGEGVSMQKAFLRAPLDFKRISSNFNLRRKHPVYKRIKAHRGIDYAAPTGTPVFAAGDGRVVSSAYTSANGNYVVIRHGERYTTKYLHLSKRKAKVGQRVKQGQIIGLVGATGLATGPHLHYEFLVDGVHRNPRTIIDQLPRARSIARAEMSRFIAAVSPYQKQLNSYRIAWQQSTTGNPPHG